MDMHPLQLTVEVKLIVLGQVELSTFGDMDGDRQGMVLSVWFEFGIQLSF